MKFDAISITFFKYCYDCADEYAHPVGCLSANQKWGHVWHPCQLACQSNCIKTPFVRHQRLSVCVCPWFGRELFSKFSYASVLLFVLTCLCWQTVTSSLCHQICLSQNRKKKSLGLNIAYIIVDLWQSKKSSLIEAVQQKYTLILPSK